MNSVQKSEARRSFSSDVVWNGVSFALMALAGVLINLLVLKVYNTSALGIFTQVFAIYMILSQLTSGGYHLSIQTYVSKHAAVQSHVSTVFLSAFLLGLIHAATVLALAYPFLPLLGKAFGSADVGNGLLRAVPGLLFFSVNKMFLALLNGLRQMRFFAVFRGLRFVFALLVLLIFIFSDSDIYWLPSCYAFAELALFFPLGFIALKHIGKPQKRRLWKWMHLHWKFGTKAFTGNLIMDVNGRTDVVMLGLFLSDAAVGIYSFASSLSEGIRQINEVFRHNFNPLLTRIFFYYPRPMLQRVIRKGVKTYYKYLASLSVLSLGGFPVVLWVFGINENSWEMSIVFGILVVGIALVSGYLPVTMLFNQVGLAGLQSRLFLFQFFVNIVLNLVLIPVLGIYGAAIATSSALILQFVYLKWMAKRHLAISI